MSKENDYQSAIDWLYSQLPMFSRIGAAAYKPGLDTTYNLDNLFNHPHRKFKSIHIAGTNGKGSTSNMLAAVLQAQGYKVGLYTSPHLVDFRERIRINGEMIPKEEVVRFVDEWKRINSALSPSFFELTMMMAFEWFARQEVDYAVIEVGMGGRLDSTNVITPILSVITNISLDHTQFLGSTLEAIASEKAGIIKHLIPVVIGEAEGEVRNVFEKKAAQECSKIINASDYKEITKISPRGFDGWSITLEDDSSFTIPLGGEYQSKNIYTVLAAINALKQIGIKLSQESVITGLKNVKILTGFRGRWEIVRKEPLVICDTGHNIDGLKQNLLSLSKHFSGKKITFVLGFVSDKDVNHIVDLFPKDASYIFTQASLPRAMKADTLASIFEEAGIRGLEIANVKEAAETAINDSTPQDVVYIGGSTFVVADFLS